MTPYNADAGEFQGCIRACLVESPCPNGATKPRPSGKTNFALCHGGSAADGMGLGTVQQTTGRSGPLDDPNARKGREIHVRRTGPVAPRPTHPGDGNN